MADKTFFGRLQTLFSTNAIVRKVGTNKIKVIDVNKIQSNSGLATNKLIDRYTKLHASTNDMTYNQYQNFQQQRLSLFTEASCGVMYSFIFFLISSMPMECSALILNLFKYPFF